ncbi:MAG: VWA domain-containing protein [Phycisphaerae bacterium]
MIESILDWFRANFHQPWVLLHLPLAALVWFRWIGRNRRPVIQYSSLDAVLAAGPTWTGRARRLLPVLRTAAILLLIICIARPRKGNEQTRIDAEGIAIQLVVDRSGSMEAMDFELDGRRASRLAVVKKVVKDFVLGVEDLPGRPDDLIGAIVFARYADGRCPLTLNHDFLVDTLEQTPIVTREDDGTAVGDALALGVERLRAVEQRRGLRPDQKIESKIIILLTDGESNAGDIEPIRAAEMAAAYGIKVYTIGAGTRGMAPYPTVDPFSGRRVLRSMPVNIDEETLTEIAQITDGQYFRATDTESLKDVYAKIDELEKTRVEERRYMEYKELATEWVRLGRVTVPPLLGCVFVLLVLEVVLGNTWLRRIP